MLENNITSLKHRITTACQQSQRTNNSVNLLAVSKTRDINTIKNAYDYGLRQFGENYVSEAEQKITALPKDIEWHFIGPVQSNKTKTIAKHFHWVQTIDRIKTAKRLNEQRPKGMEAIQCLIQVNISNEPQKSGVGVSELMPLAQFIETLPHLTLRGLMAIPKADNKLTTSRQEFAKMAQLLKQLQLDAPQADTLSMGMSKDLEAAIAQGSTMVRVGTDLFGPREHV